MLSLSRAWGIVALTDNPTARNHFDDSVNVHLPDVDVVDVDDPNLVEHPSYCGLLYAKPPRARDLQRIVFCMRNPHGPNRNAPKYRY